MYVYTHIVLTFDSNEANRKKFVFKKAYLYLEQAFQYRAVPCTSTHLKW